MRENTFREQSLDYYMLCPGNSPCMLCAEKSPSIILFRSRAPSVDRFFFLNPTSLPLASSLFLSVTMSVPSCNILSVVDTCTVNNDDTGNIEHKYVLVSEAHGTRK